MARKCICVLLNSDTEIQNDMDHCYIPWTEEASACPLNGLSSAERRKYLQRSPVFCVSFFLQTYNAGKDFIYEFFFIAIGSVRA